MKYIKTFEKLLKNTTEIIKSARRGSVYGVEKALKNGNNINSVDYDKRTALMVASLNSFIFVVDFLIKNGADVNLQDIDGRTALMMAYTFKIVKLLIHAGADVNIQNYKGENVAMVFLKYENNSDDFLNLLELFLENGLNLDQTDNNGKNLYDIIKHEETYYNGESYKLKYYFEIEAFMNSEYPKYKEDWEIKQNIEKYNL